MVCRGSRARCGMTGTAGALDVERRLAPWQPVEACYVAISHFPYRYGCRQKTAIFMLLVCHQVQQGV
ncbi:MAG: hypothetical protein LBF08_00795 [Dysgonamonadaceae bacterium]|nr:hypothetical protein [Dysgonamonadaceae bacterium]